MNSEPLGKNTNIPDGESAIDVFILCSDAGIPRNSAGSSHHRKPGSHFFLTAQICLRPSMRENPTFSSATPPDRTGWLRGLPRDKSRRRSLEEYPVLLVTGVASLGDLLGVLDSNADNFIARPYDPRSLPLPDRDDACIAGRKKPIPRKSGPSSNSGTRTGTT